MSALNARRNTLHWLFLVLAPGIALFLGARSTLRAAREPGLRWTIIGAGTIALAPCTLVTYLMALVIFDDMLSLAKQQFGTTRKS